MNQVAQRKIPEEWTPEMWQAHVCAMEKRMNELERDVHNIKNSLERHPQETLQAFNQRYRETTQEQGIAWLR